LEKMEITFDDFSKIDIRTATILEAEKVPKTTKLLKLKIDTGLDIRTIVSGIAEYYEPEAIVGRQISIVANLEPRKIKGIESRGMILMAEDEGGKLVMVTPSEKMNNGSMIR
jgi:methionyl-tRNA synthetase